MSLITARGLAKSFGDVRALDGLDLTVEAGRIVGLIGPNGSGKTTLFNSIVGYHPVDSGTVAFEGREISRLRVPEIARLGLLRTFQQTRVYGRMSALEKLVFLRMHFSKLAPRSSARLKLTPERSSPERSQSRRSARSRLWCLATRSLT